MHIAHVSLSYEAVTIGDVGLSRTGDASQTSVVHPPMGSRPK